MSARSMLHYFCCGLVLVDFIFVPQQNNATYNLWDMLYLATRAALGLISSKRLLKLRYCVLVLRTLL